jgi:hypothetical protein
MRIRFIETLSGTQTGQPTIPCTPKAVRDGKATHPNRSLSVEKQADSRAANQLFVLVPVGA